MLSGYSLLPINLGQHWPGLQTIVTSPEEYQSRYSGGLALGNQPLPELRSVVLFDSRSADDLLRFLGQPRPHLKRLVLTVDEINSAADWRAVFNLVQGLDALRIRSIRHLDLTSILQGLQQSNLAQSLSILDCYSGIGAARGTVPTWRALLPPGLKQFNGHALPV